jgi:glycogen synthase
MTAEPNTHRLSSPEQAVKRAVNPAPRADQAINNTGDRVRLLLFTNSIGTGGMEEHIELLARHIDRSHFEVCAISPDWEADEVFNRSLSQAADRWKTVTPDRRYGRWRQIKETVRFYRQIRNWKIQVMHMHSSGYQGMMVALLTARLAGVRKIYLTQHLAPDAPQPFLVRQKSKLVTQSLKGLICVSQKNYLARKQHLYTPDQKTTVVDNGVDLDDFPPIPAETVAELRQKYQLPADALVVGTVVRFEPEKGLDYLVTAMPKIRAACPNAYFLLVGDGSLRAQLEAQVAELGMTEYVRFTGFQSNPRPFFGLLDAFVLPVPVGSMSIALLEAMAMERAVVMTFGGEGEAVVHGQSGYWAEPRNPDSIANYVIAILQNPELKKALGQAARQRIEDKFSARKVARVLEKLYLQP